ncbi:hypothetical protein HDF15_004630 [Granulicella mallensis]|uniref:Uncharacterized protein n=1 Tax=Granulicella mallensis TaxID=940614 RepID=A0A7W7ZV32_9BACT|nr:hypothetical protein [Granulicella mallensis]
MSRNEERELRSILYGRPQQQTRADLGCTLFHACNSEVTWFTCLYQVWIDTASVIVNLNLKVAIVAHGYRHR